MEIIHVNYPTFEINGKLYVVSSENLKIGETFKDWCSRKDFKGIYLYNISSYSIENETAMVVRYAPFK